MAKEDKSFLSSNGYIALFIIILCTLAGGTLAIISFSLTPTQEAAKEFDQAKQMLVAAKILTPTGQFEILDPDGKINFATFDAATQTLVALDGAKAPKADDDSIRQLASDRIRPLLTNDKGDVFTLEEKGVDLAQYLAENKKEGYANLPLKLFYAILPNTAEASKISAEEIAEDLSKAEVFVIPVSGFGLWAPIYGYLALAKNGDDVIGTTWYEHAETPGLGANIAEPKWQKQFYGKLIFQQSSSGETDFKTAPLGIVVVKGKVQDVYGDSPKAKSAVDGMSGATMTGDGVTNAYRDSLTPYRSFLIKVHELNQDDTKAVPS